MWYSLSWVNVFGIKAEKQYICTDKFVSVLYFYIRVLWGCVKISKEFQVNRGIKASNVFVIGADGSQLGVLSLNDALSRAENDNLDLVQVSPGDAKNNRPPTCKMMDYGKYRYEQDKKGKEARKKQKVIDIKEIRLSVNIDVGDFSTKVKQAMGFLEKGKKIKVSIRFRGRENNNPARGYEIMSKFTEACSSLANVESPAKLEGRNMMMILSAKPANSKTKQTGEKHKVETQKESSVNESKLDVNSHGNSE